MEEEQLLCHHGNRVVVQLLLHVLLLHLHLLLHLLHPVQHLLLRHLQAVRGHLRFPPDQGR